METTSIKKEDIGKLNFNKNEVLTCTDKIAKRYNILKHSAVLGNSYKHKLKIIFHSLEGRWIVYTTIWFASESFIQIKGGIVIPVNVIEDIIN